MFTATVIAIAVKSDIANILGTWFKILAIRVFSPIIP